MVSQDKECIQELLCEARSGSRAGMGRVAVIVRERMYPFALRTTLDPDAAEDIVRPLLKRPQLIDKPSLSLGYAGVYSSFLLHTFRVVKKVGLDPRDVLIELGRRRVVGGQEDMILDVALQLKREKEGAAKVSPPSEGGEA